VARQDLSAGTQVLAVDSFNLLCVTDEPLKTGNTYGSAALADYQQLHGDLPPLLANYLVSSELCTPGGRSSTGRTWRLHWCLMGCL